MYKSAAQDDILSKKGQKNHKSPVQDDNLFKKGWMQGIGKKQPAKCTLLVHEQAVFFTITPQTALFQQVIWVPTPLSVSSSSNIQSSTRPSTIVTRPTP